MTERLRKMIAYEVEYLCEYTADCRHTVTFTGKTLPSSPPQFEHRCAKGHLTALFDIYPLIRYEPDPADD